MQLEADKSSESWSQLQDMIVEISMLLHMPIWEVLDLDMHSLNSLAESVYRVKYTDKTEDAWTAMVAAQGSGDNMKKWAERWAPALGRTYQRAKSGVARFISDFGGGF